MRSTAEKTAAVVMVLCAWRLPSAVAGSAAPTAEMVGLLEPAEDKALAPWSANTHSTDVAKRHVEEITGKVHKYTVVQGGTMDGRSCRTPTGVGMNSEGAFFQTWESNRSVRMENLGEADVIHPWLSNGRNHTASVTRSSTASLRANIERRPACGFSWSDVREQIEIERSPSSPTTPWKSPERSRTISRSRRESRVTDPDYRLPELDS